jgi:hypothetical protein
MAHVENRVHVRSPCLFCESIGPFTKPEHVIPEAMGNDDLVLRGEVCDRCNQFFGSKVENFVLEKTPIAFWRTFSGIRKKHGELPHVDLSQPKRQKGRLLAVHELHDNLVGFTCHDDYSVSVDIDDSGIVRGILDGTRKHFTFVFTPLVLSMMGRFFCKVGIELLCLADPVRARSQAFQKARKFAREGDVAILWPIFHGQTGTLSDLKKRIVDSGGPSEEVVCYRYRLLEVAACYTLLVMTVGTDTWVVCLNDPYPTPVIRQAVPETKLELIWYAPEQVNTGGERVD